MRTFINCYMLSRVIVIITITIIIVKVCKYDEQDRKLMDYPEVRITMMIESTAESTTLRKVIIVTFLATLVALHFTPVSEWVSDSFRLA